MSASRLITARTDRIAPAIRTCAIAAALCSALTAQAALVQVTVTARNLAPVNSTSFAPLRVGFNNGSFDSFNNGQTAGAAIVSVAEGGSASAWFPAFAAADANATLGTVGAVLVPGTSATQTFIVNTTINPFFTFGAMVVPSNDLFIGNDNPQAFRLFDAAGNLVINQINQKASQIWDAGSEVAIAANAAFIVGGNNALRVAQNGVVSFSASELGVFNGLTTAAGYVFSNAALAANPDIYSISFTANAVPEPQSYAMVGLALLALGVTGRRRGQKARAG